jgi:D-alanyl-D-alanine endopeptidase (penicillin-binding protein 7)
MQRSSLPRVLLLLAAFVFFSANTVYFVEEGDGRLRAEIDKVYHFDWDHVKVQKNPYLNVKSAIAVNYDNGEVLYGKNEDKPRAIASITKLMMAMVVIDQGVDLSTTEAITKKDAYRSSRSRLRVGYELTLGDLLYAALMNSDNRAARALARATCGSIDAFVEEMNHKAKLLKLKHTTFVEPTGLDSRNQSTAHEVAKLLHYALDYDLIAKITSKKSRRVKVQNRKNTYLQMANTNILVHSRYKVYGGKTGYIRAADYCLTTLIENKKGEKVTLVVLGAPGDKTRFKEARKLADWSFREIRKSSQALASSN